MQHHLFGALFGRGWVQPFPREHWRENHRPPVVNVDHPAGAIGSDDHKSVVLARFVLLVRVLADCGAKDWGLVAVPDQVGLLFRPAFVYPFEPVVDRDDCPMRPNRAEERSVGDFLHAGVNWRGAVFRPMRAPSPANHVRVQKLAFLVEEGQLSGVGAALYRSKGCSPVELISAFGMLSAATKSWIPLYWESRPHIAP